MADKDIRLEASGVRLRQVLSSVPFARDLLCC